MASYVAKMQADGSLYGERPNAGVVVAADGVGTYRATGAGSFTADDGTSFRGVAYFQSPSTIVICAQRQGCRTHLGSRCYWRCCLGALGSRLDWSKITGSGAVPDENRLCWKVARQTSHLRQGK